MKKSKCQSTVLTLLSHPLFFTADVVRLTPTRTQSTQFVQKTHRPHARDFCREVSVHLDENKFGWRHSSSSFLMTILPLYFFHALLCAVSLFRQQILKGWVQVEVSVDQQENPTAYLRAPLSRPRNIIAVLFRIEGQKKTRLTHPLHCYYYESNAHVVLSFSWHRHSVDVWLFQYTFTVV